MITIAVLTGIVVLIYLLYKITKPYKFYEEEDKEIQLKRREDK